MPVSQSGVNHSQLSAETTRLLVEVVNTRSSLNKGWSNDVTPNPPYARICRLPVFGCARCHCTITSRMERWWFSEVLPPSAHPPVHPLRAGRCFQMDPYSNTHWYCLSIRRFWLIWYIIRFFSIQLTFTGQHEILRINNRWKLIIKKNT